MFLILEILEDLFSQKDSSVEDDNGNIYKLKTLHIILIKNFLKAKKLKF